MTPARFRWGIILIQVGLLLLLMNLRVINEDWWLDLLVLFPVVLIAIGIEKIFSRTRLKFISYLSSVGLFFAGLAIAWVGSGEAPYGGFFRETRYELQRDPAVSNLSVNLDLDATNLTVRDSDHGLVVGRFDRFTRKPRIDTDEVDGRMKVTMSSRDNLWDRVVNINTDSPQDWSLRFSDEVPLELECRGTDSDVHLNMATTPLRQLKLDADESRIYLKLGELLPDVKVDISGRDSDLRLRVPETAGVSIDARGYDSYFRRLGMSEKGGLYYTDGFDTVSVKIELRLDDDLGLTIDFF